jgi:hypothetical protein
VNELHPTMATLLAVSLEFLRGNLLPRLEGADAFNLRVAANAIDLVRRQIELGNDARSSEHRRLVRALGTEGDITVLREALCNRLASDPDFISRPEVQEALRETVLDQLAIEQPSYSGYLAARG